MLKQESLVELFVDTKISNLQKKSILSLEEKKDLLKLYNQYGFGVLMESSDRAIIKNYSKGIENYKKAYDNFVAARILGIGILSLKYDNFEELLIKNKEFNFEEEDIMVISPTNQRGKDYYEAFFSEHKESEDYVEHFIDERSDEEKVRDELRISYLESKSETKH